MTEFLSCRPNLEVDDLAPAVAFLREVLGFEAEVDEPEMGLVLLRRDAVGLALVRSATPGVNATTAVYISVTGVDTHSLAYAGWGAVKGDSDNHRRAPSGRVSSRAMRSSKARSAAG